MRSLRAVSCTFSAVLIAAGCCAVASPASAATVSRIDTLGGEYTVHFVAGSGEANYLRGVELAGTQEGVEYVRHYRFTDRYTISAGTGCAYPSTDHRVVVCSLSEGVGDFHPQFSIDLGDGVDRVDFAPNVGQDSSLDAGPGDDVIDAGVTFTDIDGGSGNDVITGDGSIKGGDGNDKITVTGPGSGITGGRGNDTITGSSSRDLIYGNSGNDTIRAGRGADTVSGGPGNDTVYGNSGDDVLKGGPGRDKISGGPGSDKISG